MSNLTDLFFTNPSPNLYRSFPKEISLIMNFFLPSPYVELMVFTGVAKVQKWVKKYKRNG